MKMASSEKIVLVTRPTRLTGLRRRFNTTMNARFYIQSLKADFSDYENEEEQYNRAVEMATEILGRFRRVQAIDRSFLTNFMFAPTDIVVTLGQDGLVANTLKYLDGQPLVGVNPDPNRWDGVLLPFEVKDLEKIIPEVLSGKRRQMSVTMAEATLSTKQSLYAVNDFFIGTRTHGSARYEIMVAGKKELQSSSGIIISTGLGSTGWMRSVITGARQMMVGLTGKDISPIQKDVRVPWDSPNLTFFVREPFPSRNTQAGLVYGTVDIGKPLEICSMMPENGVIFSDGIEADFVEFSSGTRATIAPAKRQGHVVV